MSKPIRFRDSMVRAIKAGWKTQTRLVIKPQPELHGNVWVMFDNYFLDDEGLESYLYHDVYGNDKSPYGEDDILWVQETWAAHKYLDDTKPSDFTPQQQALRLWYRADGEQVERGRWRPSIHMPRWASRITLRVTDIKVERLQEITYTDALAEGVIDPEYARGRREWMVFNRFERYWDFINAHRGHNWESNPWVWVVEFEQETGDEL